MQRRIRFAAFLLFPLAIVSACNDNPGTAPTTTLDARTAVLDGASGGNPHFFFHAPLGATVSYGGAFNGNMAPTVEVCRTTELTATGHCVSLLASFEKSGGVNTGGAKVEINQTGQHYQVSFNTKLYPITTNAPFRIAVLLGDLLIGYTDVVARSGGKYENATTGAAIVLQNGRTIPIKFRIENGVVCGNNVN